MGVFFPEFRVLKHLIFLFVILTDLGNADLFLSSALHNVASPPMLLSSLTLSQTFSPCFTFDGFIHGEVAFHAMPSGFTSFLF